MADIKHYRELLKTKALSCTELTEAFLSAAEKENPGLNAYISITKDAALKTAAEVDAKIARGEELGPLEGIPVVIKDNICTKGIRTTCASRMLENYVPFYDATVWELLNAQGAVLIGKGNMDEFAMGSTNETSYFGRAKNPHNYDYVAGGSSGGVAAAVAGKLAAFGIGTDTGGSIRQPASFCGVYGLKPTYGAVSRYGIVTYASSFDQAGVFANSAEDTALVFDAISKRDERDMTSVGSMVSSYENLGRSIKGLKIGIASEDLVASDEEVNAAVENAKEIFKSLGAEIVEIKLPFIKDCLPVYYILACAEASSNLGKFDGVRYGYHAEDYDDVWDMMSRTRSEGFGDEVKRRIILGTYVLSSGYFDAYYKKAQRLRASITKEFDKILDTCDMILAPTVPITPLKAGAQMSPVDLYRTDICTCAVNIVGLPSMSVPAGFTENDLPVGVQLIGGRFKEDVILNAAYAFEKATEGRYIKSLEMGCGI